jgi:hypothetical protein
MAMELKGSCRVRLLEGGVVGLDEDCRDRRTTRRKRWRGRGAGVRRGEELLDLGRESGFSWQYHLVNWPTVCRPKEVGGLGLLNTKKMNQALLLKWIWRLYQEEDTIWAKLIRAKYRDADDIFSGSGQGGSPFWKSLHKVKHLFKVGAKHLVRDGACTNFWLDRWIDTRPLKESFPALFAICDDEAVSVAQALQGEGLAIRFRRAFDHACTTQRSDLCDMVDDVGLVHGKDQIRWHLENSGIFLVKSLYFKLS